MLVSNCEQLDDVAKRTSPYHLIGSLVLEQTKQQKKNEIKKKFTRLEPILRNAVLLSFVHQTYYRPEGTNAYAKRYR